MITEKRTNSTDRADATNAAKIKRSKSNLERYGVENSYQTTTAKDAFAAVYENKDRVAEIVNKTKQTKKERYGSETYQNVEKMKETMAGTYTPEYWAERYGNPNIVILHDRDALLEMATQKTLREMAEFIGVNIETVRRRIKKYQAQ